VASKGLTREEKKDFENVCFQILARQFVSIENAGVDGWLKKVGVYEVVMREGGLGGQGSASFPPPLKDNTSITQKVLVSILIILA
jgi:hypothetical protein